jgi:hypothetical protein
MINYSNRWMKEHQPLLVAEYQVAEGAFISTRWLKEYPQHQIAQGAADLDVSQEQYVRQRCKKTSQ